MSAVEAQVVVERARHMFVALVSWVFPENWSGLAMDSSVTQTQYQTDMIIMAIFAVGMFLFWIPRKLILEPLSRYYFLNKPWVRDDLNDYVTRFVHTVTEFGFYTCFLIIGTRVLLHLNWVWPSSLWWEGYLSGEHEQTFTTAERGFYLLYGGRYAQLIVTLLIEPKMKDFLEMLIHHITTVILIAGSYYLGFVRIGLVIMVLLDVSDPFLHGAKIIKEFTGNQAYSMVPFVLFVLSFYFTRLVVYTYVCWSVTFESTEILRRGNHPPEMGEHFMRALCQILMVLQVYWSYLIFRVVQKAIFENSLEDVRETEELAKKKKTQ